MLGFRVRILCDATHSRNATCLPFCPTGASGDATAIRDVRIKEGAAVGLIEFADADGVRWRVWHVETPPARAHLMDPQYRNGWLVFEREDGTDRRRLNRVPDDWTSLSPDRLAQLCRVAVPAVASRNTPSGSQPAWARSEPDSR